MDFSDILTISQKNMIKRKLSNKKVFGYSKKNRMYTIHNSSLKENAFYYPFLYYIS